MRQDTALTVLHGSNLGTCRSLARRVADAELLRLSPDQIIDLRPRPRARSAPLVDRPVTVRELLTHFVELQDLLEVDPSDQLPLEVLLGLLPARRPRYYSISSSALVEPGCIRLIPPVGLSLLERRRTRPSRDAG